MGRQLWRDENNNGQLVYEQNETIDFFNVFGKLEYSRYIFINKTQQEQLALFFSSEGKTKQSLIWVVIIFFLEAMHFD